MLGKLALLWPFPVSRLNHRPILDASRWLLACSVVWLTTGGSLTLAQDPELNQARAGSSSARRAQEETSTGSQDPLPGEVQEENSLHRTPRNQGLYEVPPTDQGDRLVRFISTAVTFEPETLQEYRLHVEQGSQAISTAGQRLVEMATGPEDRLYRIGRIAEVQGMTLKLPFLDGAMKQQAVERVTQLLQEFGADAELYGVAKKVARVLEQAQETELAVAANQQFGETFAASDDPKLATGGERMLGAATRLQLVGQSLTISGQTLSGEPLNWDEFAGKTVLVYFWSTAVGPVETEIPQIKQLEEQYGEQGFTVISVCLDDRRKLVEEYFSNNDLTFVCLFEEDKGWSHPLALRLGIDKLPTGILIDAEGVVVALDARGSRLVELLEERFGK